MTTIEVPMRQVLTVPALLICGAILCAPPAFAQGVANPGANPGASANSAASPAQMENRANADVAAASASTGAPVVNLPDPHNAGTLAESARTTALAGYPWSTADIWFGKR
jgi:hypothetical protein